MFTDTTGGNGCRYCGATLQHTPERCPQIKAIDYYKDGSIKRVELGQRFPYNGWQWQQTYPTQTYPNQITWTSSTATS